MTSFFQVVGLLSVLPPFTSWVGLNNEIQLFLVKAGLLNPA